MEFVTTFYHRTIHPKVLLLSGRKDSTGYNHFTASMFKQTDTMFLTSQQSYVANNESCNSNVTIKTSIINQGHNIIDKSRQPAATRTSESGIEILVECSSRPTAPAIWQHLWNWTLDWTACVVCTSIQCSTVQYSTVHAICAVLLWLYVPGVGWDWGPSFLAPGSRCRWSSRY